MEIVFFILLALLTVAYGCLFRFERFTLSIARQAREEEYIEVSVGTARTWMTPPWIGLLTVLVQGSIAALVILIFIGIGWAVGLVSVVAIASWVLFSNGVPFPSAERMSNTARSEH